jgi:lipoprotein signal peptidase
MTRIRPARPVLVVVAAAVFAVDQVTKSLVVHLVGDRVVAWGPVSLAVSRNSGGHLAGIPYGGMTP